MYQPRGPAPGSAVAALVLGLLVPILFIITGIPAIICGHLALRAIKRSDFPIGGKGMAITGMVLGYLSVVVPVGLLLVLLLIPPGTGSNSGPGPAIKGDGIVKTESRTVPTGITGLDVKRPIRVIVHTGADAPRAEITGDGNLVSNVTLTPDPTGRVLVVDSSVNYKTRIGLKAEIWLEGELTSIRKDSLSKVHADAMKGSHVRIEALSGGRVVVDSVSADLLRIKKTGVAGVDLKGGRVKEMEIDAEGAGDLELKPVNGEVARVTGSGTVDVNIGEFQVLEANNRSGVYVNYAGSPTVTGNGSVEPY